MALTVIPSISYQIEGDVIKFAAGESGVITIHRIHLEHLAKEFGVSGVNAEQQSGDLRHHLEKIKNKSEDLYYFMAGVPCVPPHDYEDEDVLLARQLMELAQSALSMFGGSA